MANFAAPNQAAVNRAQTFKRAGQIALFSAAVLLESILLPKIARADVYKQFQQAKNGQEITLTFKSSATGKDKTLRGIIENKYEKIGKDGKRAFGCYLTLPSGKKLDVEGSKMKKIVPVKYENAAVKPAKNQGLQLTRAKEEKKPEAEKKQSKKKQGPKPPEKLSKTKDHAKHAERKGGALDARHSSYESNGVGGRVNLSTTDRIIGFSQMVKSRVALMFSHRERETTGVGVNGVSTRPVTAKTTDTTVGVIQWIKGKAAFVYAKLGIRGRNSTTVSEVNQSASSSQSAYAEVGVQTNKHNLWLNNQKEGFVTVNGQRHNYTGTASASKGGDDFQPAGNSKINPANLSRRDERARSVGGSKQVTRKKGYLTTVGVREDYALDKLSGAPNQPIQSRTRARVLTVGVQKKKWNFTAGIGRVLAWDRIGAEPEDNSSYQTEELGVSRPIGKDSSITVRWNRAGGQDAASIAVTVKK